MSDNLSIQEIHNEELMMLDSIVAFCSSHNLKYWLVGGTLLGAVRHKGFIPWDDDVDIGMPRQDYEEFINSWTNSKYKVLSAANVDYHLPYAKIVDTKTKIVSKSRASKEIETGLFIDIFHMTDMEISSQLLLGYNEVLVSLQD
ncbi:LicD family protein [Lacticaseibacillus sharpeae]|uniref:LicD family protein n=1 Tax=Lacticaseibacillus sharpeae TaxID=1626 RepID=UPI0006D227F6|nr:LicD family protein [Lacticaseibacillus sharpeae]